MKTNLVSRLLGRGAFARSLEARAPLYHPDFPAVILWSEKAACTTAVKWFFFHIGKLDEARALHHWVHIYENDVFKAAPDYLADCATAIAAGVPVIKFVRDPYQRLFSGYLELCHPRVLTQEDHWAVWTRAAIVKQLNGAQATPSDPISFNQFCQWLAQQPVRSLDGHLAPQLMLRDKRMNVEPVRLEDHDNPFGYLEDRLGLPSSLDDRRVHQSGHHHDKQYFSDADAQAALNAPLLPDRPSGVPVFGPSSTAIAAAPGGAIVRRVFAADFAAYGYPDRI